MSLRVWLPLTKDLRNQGLDDVTVTNHGATFNSAGKLGGCYSFNGSSSYLNFNEKVITSTSYSISFWIKVSNISGNKCIICCRSASNYAFAIYLINAALRIDTGSNWSTGYNLTAGSWYHAAFTTDGTIQNLYINGLQVATRTSSTSINQITSFCTIGAEHTNGSNIGVYFNGSLNDVRIYDHCLSPMEVKQLSQGLVLHYPLSDNSIQQLNNCYTNPTFDSSSAGAGWWHWGSSGHKGTYGQNTDSNYIYREGQSYSHWVADGADATKNYLVYQSPAFEGGQRSLQCICKEENSLPIDESIVFPDWNARNGGAITGKWTSIISLGNGFYHCKCENIQQDGSNDLIGFYIRPGYKVYFSEAYVENDRECCSDIFYPTTTIYDCSGFCNNGVISGSLSVSSDTPKYQVSTFLSNNTSKLHISGLSTSGFGNSYSIAWWGKTNSFSGLMQWGFSDGIRLNGIFNGNLWNTGDSANNPLYIPGTTTQVTAPTTNEWHHFVMTGDGTTCKVYKDGELWGQAKTYKAISGTSIYFNGWDSGTSYSNNNGYSMSDFRIYATALSASDVKSLYQNSAYIDSSGNVYGAVHSEV